MSSSSLLSFPAVMFDKNDSAKFTTQKNRSALKMNPSPPNQNPYPNPNGLIGMNIGIP